MRLLFYLVLGYVIWKIIQVALRAIASPPREGGSVFGQRPDQKKETFKDVKDADFEELPPDEKK